MLRSTALPLLLAIIYTNFSDIAMRSFSMPSVLQPLIVILAIAICYEHKALGAASIVAQPLTLALAAYVLVLFCSSVWAADTRLADERIVDGVKNLAMFLIIATLAASPRAMRRAVAVLAAAASVLAIITIHQTLAHDYAHEWLGFARIQIAQLYGNVVELRPAGPVGDPNFYAQFLLMIVPLAFFGALAETQRARRIALFAAAAIITAGTLLTYSRGAAIALTVMTVLTLITVKVRVRHVAAFAAVAVVIMLVLPRGVTERLITIESLVPGSDMQVDSSIMKRKLLLASAARMFDEHPLLGVGAGNFARWFPRYANETGSSAPQYDDPGEHAFPHTLYLEIGAETGILGLAAFAAVIACAFATSWRSRHDPIARGLAIALCGYLITSIFLHGSYQRYLWMLLALIAANLGRQAPSPVEASSASDSTGGAACLPAPEVEA